MSAVFILSFYPLKLCITAHYVCIIIIIIIIIIISLWTYI